MAQLKRNRFKILFLDVGLVQHVLKVDPKAILEGALLQINRGAIAEQFVGQELLAYHSPYEAAQLFYWEKGSAEVDYLYVYGQKIIPIEVKAGKTGRMKSLRAFGAEVGVRISQSGFSQEGEVLSVPFWQIGQLSLLLS